jgi:orotate phosphoribosyltransferase
MNSISFWGFKTSPPPAVIILKFSKKSALDCSKLVHNRNTSIVGLAMIFCKKSSTQRPSNKYTGNLFCLGKESVKIIRLSFTKTLYICGMILNKDTAKKTAELLLQIKAIKLSPNEPFTWASGWKSPIYCDNRITLSYPAVRVFLKEEIAKIVEQQHGKPDVIAGVATGAIAIGILVAQELGVPFIYVRPEPKSHGRKNQIEGYLESGQNVVVIEDLISTGKSSLNAVASLKEAGAVVKGMVAIFTYGFEIADTNFKEKNVTLTTLSNYDNLLEQASDSSYISENEIDTLQEWRKNPSNWKQ